MDALTIALITTIPFLGIIFALYRVMRHEVKNQKMTPFFASLIVWIAALCLPWFLNFLWWPLGTHIFRTYPSLQTAAWDVGLAISLYIGMYLAYFFGVLTAIICSYRLYSLSYSRLSESSN